MTDALPLILASGSPRRRELLAGLGLDFRVLTPDDGAEDARADGETPEDYVRRQAVQKARNVAEKAGSGRILACDTIVVCRGEILGKPVDRADAGRMLRLLRGETHFVLSGLCLWTRPGPGLPGRYVVELAETELFLHPISDREIEDYLDGGVWRGKAGAFGYQDRNARISIVRGSESNVVGLPLELLEKTDFPEA